MRTSSCVAVERAPSGRRCSRRRPSDRCARPAAPARPAAARAPERRAPRRRRTPTRQDGDDAAAPVAATASCGSESSRLAARLLRRRPASARRRSRRCTDSAPARTRRRAPPCARSGSRAARRRARRRRGKCGRPACSAIFRCRSLSLRGPSTISTPRAANTGRGLPAPNGASDATPAATPPVMPRNVRSPSIRSRGIRSSGPSVSSATSLTASAELPDPRRIHRQAGGLLVAAEPDRAAARSARARASMSKRGNAPARPVRHAVLDRQHDRRPVERVDELRRDDADDAAVPAFAGDDQHRARADVRIGLDDLLRGREDLGFLLLPPDVLAVELLRQRPRFVAHRLVARQQQPRRDVGRAHAAGGVDARREHERDVIAVDRLAGQAGRRRAARAGRPCAGRASAGRGRASR